MCILCKRCQVFDQKYFLGQRQVWYFQRMKQTFKVSVLALLDDAPPKTLKTKSCPSVEAARSLAGAIMDNAPITDRSRLAVNIVEER